MTFKELNVVEFKSLFPITENSDLAKKYNVKESTVRLWAAKLKLNKKTWLWTRQDENFILKHYGKKKYTIVEIAKKLGRTKWSVINKHREIAKNSKRLLKSRSIKKLNSN